MVSSDNNKVIALKNQIISKINGLVSAHNSNSSAHSTQFQSKEDTTNKVTSWSTTVTDTKYPSEKLVKNSLNAKQDHLSSLDSVDDIYGNIIFEDNDGIFNGINNRIYHDWGNTNELHFINSDEEDVNFDDIILEGDSRLTNARTPTSHTHDDRYYTESEVDTALNSKQDTLISGTTIKTINGQSLLDMGNIQIDSGSFDFAEIPQGDDLDDYNWQGAFYCTSAYSTISNIPVISPFIVTVDGDVNVLQTFVDLTNKDIYTRVCFNSTFSAWKKQATSDDLLEKTYPIGSIYMSVNNTNPQTLFGGTWEQIAQGRTIIGQGTGTDSNSVSKTFTNGATGGEYNHTLTTSEMPKHKHQTGSRSTYGSGSAWGLINYGSNVSTQNRDTSETGSGNAHNNIQPYFVCYIWKRTA